MHLKPVSSGFVPLFSQAPRHSLLFSYVSNVTERQSTFIWILKLWFDDINIFTTTLSFSVHERTELKCLFEK